MAAIPNNRLFIVDNSLAQDRQWLLDLFSAMIPLKKKWVSHPILDDDRVLALAAEAGAWYVYQAIFDTSDVIRNRVKRLKDHGIGIEGTILLGTDEQDEDYIKRLIDFLLEIGIDMAEFTILTPFPHSPNTGKAGKGRPYPQQQLARLYGGQGRLSTEAHDPGKVAGNVSLRLGHLLSGRGLPDQNG